MRPMRNHDTQRDYWRLMETNGNSRDSERLLETQETQRDIWRIMRPMGTHETHETNEDS